MIDPRGRGLLGSGIASVLRVGTLVAMAVVGIGYLLLLASGQDPGSPPLVALIQDGGAAAIVGLGLFGLTLLPVLVLGVAVIGFRRLHEHRLVATALLALLLLLASLATAVVLTLLG
jgi:uncharacterized membrane protein